MELATRRLAVIHDIETMTEKYTQVHKTLEAVTAMREANPMLGLRGNVLDAPSVATVRTAGLGIGGWACNDAAAIAKMFDLGVDVFTTDRPDLALEIRAGRQRRA